MEQLKEVDALKMINEALNTPGRMLEAYRAFHQFSLNNAYLASAQLRARGLDISPIKTFKQWQEYGRSVKKGEKAIALLMPCQFPKKITDPESGEEKTIYYNRGFMEKRYWFALSQTKEFKSDCKKLPQKLANPQWDKTKALKKLDIKVIPFSQINGGCQGYAVNNEVAINPLAQLPLKTLFHEMAHVILGHTKIGGGLAACDNEIKSVIEAEAEMTAYLCLACLGLDGLEYCRGYIQKWLKDFKFSEKSARSVFTAANKILQAGVN